MTTIDKNRFGPWAIVTGASSGLGKEFARQLAASGLNLVLVARRLALLEEVGRGVAKEFGVQYRAVGVDLIEAGYLEKIEAATRDLDLGLLVSNAGDGNPGEFLAIDSEALHRIVRLNVMAHLSLTHHFGRRLAKRGRGGVLLVSAMGAADGLPYMANDAATKAYVISLGQGLHLEFQKLGLNLTVLLPGPTDTPVLNKFGFDLADMPMKPMPVEQCVAEGLAALKANRPTHLSGRMNRILAALMPRSITRQMLGSMIAKGASRRRLQAKRPGELSSS